MKISLEIFFKNKRKIALYFFGGAILFFIAFIAFVYLTRLPYRLEIPGSRVIEFADASPMCVYITPDQKWRIPVGIDEVDTAYIDALIRFEDKRFYNHPGVDPIAIIRAIIQNVRERRVVSGASTITMQLVRLLEPRPRTISSKIIEMFRAFQLELRMTKKDILEKYLQFLPFGKNVEGVEAAAISYFGHRARDLSPFEIAYLLSVPMDPEHRYPSENSARIMPDIAARTARRLANTGIFNADMEAEAKRGEPISSMKPFPRRALHASQYLSERYPGDRMRSTIRRETQAAAENALANYKYDYALMGIHNAAAIVIENDTGKVAAAVGNFDFWDAKHKGQNIGFMAPRSPGSSMKPFIYALAIDRGMVLPGYLVPDIPIFFSGYEPINYDKKFRGIISLEGALSLSINVPFVNLLKDIGVSEYLDFLIASGITTLNEKPGYYGLSMAIGGVEIKLAELANMYAMLAHNGEYRDLKWIEGEALPDPKRLLSPGACYLTRRTLRLRDRPDFPTRRIAAPLSVEIFWKTGTSSKYRDAWALGSTTKYTAGVWVGNFDGTSSRQIMGADRAGVILFDILEALSRSDHRASEDKIPSDLIEIEVCSWSGRPVGKYCPSRKTALAIRTNIPTETCPFHVEYVVDEKSGYRLNPLCRAGKHAVPKIFTVLPASTRRWISDVNLEAAAPPPLDPGCPHVATGQGIRIISPKKDAVFILVAGLKRDRQEIPLEAEAGADVGELYWFLDGRYISTSAPQERVWLIPEPGKHEVRVLDASGRGDIINITILPPG